MSRADAGLKDFDESFFLVFVIATNIYSNIILDKSILELVGMGIYICISVVDWLAKCVPSIETISMKGVLTSLGRDEV